MTFLFDANLPHHVPAALAAFGEDTVHVREVPELGSRSADVEWLAHAGMHGWCVVSRDLAILRRHDERAALTAHAVGAFFVSAEVKTRCGLFQLLVRHWPEMKRTARNLERPFVMEIRENGVRPLRFRR